MTRDEAKRLIVEAVERVAGCKATELPVLVAYVMAHEDIDDFVEIVEELIAERKLVSIGYILPTMEYREKQFILPGGTAIIIAKQQKRKDEMVNIVVEVKLYHDVKAVASNCEKLGMEVVNIVERCVFGKIDSEKLSSLREEHGVLCANYQMAF